jgi:hypothetical protein
MVESEIGKYRHQKLVDIGKLNLDLPLNANSKIQCYFLNFFGKST